MNSLTQVTLDAATVARLGIRDVYDWHQRTWECFPGRDGLARDFLTRLDRKGEHFQLLILSSRDPIRPAWCPVACWRGPKSIPESYFAQSRYRFQLCANPTKKVGVQQADGSFKKNSRRVPLVTREDLVAWIRRKGEQGGFVVDEANLQATPRGREYFERNGQRGLHSAVEYRGVLTVTDSRTFPDAFRRGIGPAKAFGFGLLVIAALP